MKNIHLLPTNQPSSLCINAKNVNHIYITNDEEIKVGDYFIESLGLPDSYLVHKLSKEWKDKESFYRRCTKVILTTDQDLIKDGIQSIDDEFLQWFVKNPSCEEVEVDLECVYQGKCTKERCLNHSCNEKQYKIIIPTEEPKQLFTKGDKVLFTGKMLDEEVIDKVVTVFYTLGKGEVEDMSDIMDEYSHIYRVWNKDLKHIPKEEPKQETLDEAAERLYPTTIDSFTDGGFDLSERERLIFINGAEWQQERMYSEEEVTDFLIKYQHYLTVDDDIDADEWFTQFKKK